MSTRCPNDANGVHFIPNGLLACPVCADEKSVAAFREYQKYPLRQIAQGKYALVTRVVNSIRHVQMVGCERTYCNISVDGRHRRDRATLNGFLEATDRVCEKCQREIKAIIFEAVCSS